MRPKLTYANVMSTLCFFLLLGGGAYAAGHLGKNSVGPKQLKKSSVTTAKVKKEAITAAKVKKGTLTGTQIDISSLGTVPNAQTAQTAQSANALAPSEPLHEVGKPGEPAFHGTWQNPPPGVLAHVAFFKDQGGMVHLAGSASGGVGTIFQLPVGYRPARGVLISIPGVCDSCDPEAQPVAIAGTNVLTFEDGQVSTVDVGGGDVSLSGISFRAES